MAVKAPGAIPPFSKFFGEQAPAVARLLAVLVPAGEVEELVQETFLSALTAYDRFDGRNPRAWVLAIARRKAIDAHRTRARTPRTEPADEELPARLPVEGSSADSIWADVAELPPKQRAALLMRFALDMPHREIGEVLGCSEPAARRNVHEGIAKLRAGAVRPAATPAHKEARR
jgi:RNA polymerase sigma factor (sigma-70 family)